MACWDDWAPALLLPAVQAFPVEETLPEHASEIVPPEPLYVAQTELGEASTRNTEAQGDTMRRFRAECTAATTNQHQVQCQSPDHTHAIRVLDQSGRRPSLFTSPKQSDTNAGSGDTNFGYFQPSSAPIQEDRGSGRGGSKEEQRDRDTEAQKEPWMNRLEDMHCQGRSEGKGSRAVTPDRWKPSQRTSCQTTARSR